MAPTGNTTLSSVVWFGTKSHSRKEVVLTIYGTEDQLRLPVEVTTKTSEVRALLGQRLGLEPDNFSFVVRQASSHRRLRDSDEIRTCIVRGIESWVRKKADHPHPIGLIGAGHHGLRQALSFLKEGISDFVVVDRLDRVGGVAWVKNANPTSKLQTELGVYHLQYDEDYATPRATMRTWPTRDELLGHFEAVSEEYGIMAHVVLGMSVQRTEAIVDFPDKPAYDLDRQYFNATAVPSKNEEGDITGQVDWKFSALAVYPGGLTNNLRVDYPGEEVFEGQLGYGMFEEFDYSQVDGQEVAIIGMGAFGVENVRTCLEHGASKVYLICRRKNITMPRVVSWFCNQSLNPPSVPMILDACRCMYDLIPDDPWSYYSVIANADRTVATVRQRARFGIGDVYFLARYYGLCELHVDSIKRFTPSGLSMESGTRLDVQHFIKVLGFQADASIDKLIGIREMQGFFANGDWRRWVFTESPGVDAGRIGGTSLSPGAISTVETCSYFFNYPKDAHILIEAGILPRHKADKDKGTPAYQWAVRDSASIGMVMGSGFIPALAEIGAKYGPLNRRKQIEAHPLEHFIDEAAEEWDMYCDKWGEGSTKPRPKYPYSYEYVREIVAKNDAEG